MAGVAVKRIGKKLEQWDRGGGKRTGKMEREKTKREKEKERGRRERRERGEKRGEKRREGFEEGGEYSWGGVMRRPTDQSLVKAILLGLSRSQIDQGHAGDASKHQALFSRIARFECHIF
jgi:hypothetical protein